MCIIVSKEKGVKLPTKETLKNCFINNDDGAGFMYVKNNQVMIDKGYMTFEDFYKRLKELKKEFNSDLTDKALVFHFRIGTHGKNDKETTHPFPITSKYDELRKTKTTCNVGMAHNGIIYSYNYDNILSDTQSFIKDYISVFRELDKKFYKNKRVMDLIDDKIGSSKLCFLDNKENIYYLGDFITDEGVKYSNGTYKTSRYLGYDYNYNYNYNNTNSYNSKSILDTYKEDTKMTTREFVSEHESYDVLEVGDFYEIDGEIYEVKKDDYLMLDEDNSLYEYYEGGISLVGLNVKIYKQNELWLGGAY